MKPKVSVVITTYNRPDMLGQAIDSVLAQKCDFPFEIIIGDDCSIDNTPNVVRTYQEKYPEIVKPIFNEQNIGLGANWAICVKSCQGEYIACLDDDDIWHNPQKLQLQVHFMEKNNANVVFTYHRIWNRKTNKYCEKQPCVDRSVSFIQSVIHSQWGGMFSSVMLRADFLKKHVPLDDFIKYKFYCQDWPTLMILAQHTNFHTLPVSTYSYSIANESLSRQKSYESIARRFQNERAMCKYIFQKCNREYTQCEEDYFQKHTKHVMLALAYKRFEYKRAKQYAQGDKSLMGRCAKTAITFYALCALRCFLKNRLRIHNRASQ